MGPNGAGKSTLFGVLAGLIRPDAGRVSIDGMPPSRWLRSGGLGVLPDQVRLPPHWSVEGALTRLAILEGLTAAERRRRIDAAVDRAGLQSYLLSPVRGLSRGLRKRLGIAQLFLSRRDLLLLDEPFTELDPVWRSRLSEQLGVLRKRQPAPTILVASHEIAETAPLADDVAVLKDGRVTCRIGARQLHDARAREDTLLPLLSRDSAG